MGNPISAPLVCSDEPVCTQAQVTEAEAAAMLDRVLAQNGIPPDLNGQACRIAQNMEQMPLPSVAQGRAYYRVDYLPTPLQFSSATYRAVSSRDKVILAAAELCSVLLNPASTVEQVERARLFVETSAARTDK